MEYIGWAGLFIGMGLFVVGGVIAGSFNEISTSIDNFNEQFERWVDAQVPPEPLECEVEDTDDEDDPGFDLFGTTPEYPDPTEADLESPRFQAVWEAIKGWDIARDGRVASYSSPTGNDVMHILKAIDKRLGDEGLKSWANPQ